MQDDCRTRGVLGRMPFVISCQRPPGPRSFIGNNNQILRRLLMPGLTDTDPIMKLSPLRIEGATTS